MSTSSNGQSGAVSKPELGIAFTWRNDYGTPVLAGHMVQFGAGRYSSDPEVKWRRVLNDWDAPYKDLEDFSVELILSESNYASEGLRRNVYRSAEYRQAYTVNLTRAKGMVRMLDRLERGLTKAADEDGYAATDGQWVIRVARALGAKWIVFDSTLSNEYSGGERQVRVNAEGIGAVDHITKYWQEHGTNVFEEQRRQREQAARDRREAALAASRAAEEALTA